MELREISVYEAKLNDLPASEMGLGEECIWYGLDDEGVYKGFMCVIEYDGISEINFFMVPDLYQGNGYGSLMLEKFLDIYIPASTPESMLTTSFEFNGDYGEELSEIFSDHGFEISLIPLKECVLPFDTVYKRLSSKKPLSYKGRMMKLAEGIGDVFENAKDLAEMDISVREIRNANLDLSAVAVNPEGKVEGLLIVNWNYDSSEAVITDLYSSTEDGATLRKLLAFAVENAAASSEVPELISFVAANEKLEKVMEMLFDNPITSQVIMADAEFDLGKYVEQLKLMSSLRR